MGYKVALEKAWGELANINGERLTEVRFLADTYIVDMDAVRVISASCNVPAPDYISILVLHYTVKRSKGLSPVTGKWISFQELPGGQGYFDAFKKRAIGPISRKYGDSPGSLAACLERLPGKKTQHGDSGVVLEAFDGVPVLVTVWGKDEEFPADANIHFDESIAGILCTEDIAVLSDIISRSV